MLRLFVAILVLCTLLAGATTTTTIVSVTVMYPDDNFPSGPNSTTVGLRGSYPLSWTASLPLHYVSRNTWTSSFAIAASVLNASFPIFSVDTKVMLNESIWQIGRNDRTKFTYQETSSSSVTVPLDLFPYFFTFAGETQVLSDIESPQLNNTRDVWLYIPAGMRENEFRIEPNVLVMQDGQNLQSLWNVNGQLDQLIASGQMASVFVVGPYSTSDRIAEYTYSTDPKFGGGKGGAYLDFLEQTLLPLVQDMYNIDTQAMNLGIMGSSLGGLISCYAGVTRSYIFSVAVCMSSSFWWNDRDFLTTIVPQLNTTAASTKQWFYVDSGDSGDDDDDLVDTSAVSSALVRSGSLELGHNFFWYLDHGGQHNERYWSARFHIPMQWLYSPPALNNANGL